MKNGQWKKVYRAQIDYLANKKQFYIVETRLKSEKSKHLKRMVEWCYSNISGSWCVASLEEYNYLITFRFWSWQDQENFKGEFTNYLLTK